MPTFFYLWFIHKNAFKRKLDYFAWSTAHLINLLFNNINFFYHSVCTAHFILLRPLNYDPLCFTLFAFFTEMLILVPNNQGLNIIVTTSIFVLLAHEVHKITEVLVPLLVPSKLTLLLRNVILSCSAVFFFYQFNYYALQFFPVLKFNI